MKRFVAIFIWTITVLVMAASVEERYEGYVADLNAYRMMCGGLLNTDSQDIDLDEMRSIVSSQTFVKLFNKYSATSADEVFGDFDKSVKAIERRYKKPKPIKQADDSMVKAMQEQIDALAKEKSKAAKTKIAQLEKGKKQLQKIVDDENAAEKQRYEMAVENRNSAIRLSVGSYVREIRTVESKIKSEMEKLESAVTRIRQNRAEKAQQEKAAAEEAARRQRIAEEEEAARIAEANKPRPTVEQEIAYRSNKSWYDDQLDYNDLRESHYEVNLVFGVESLSFYSSEGELYSITKCINKQEGGYNITYSRVFPRGFAERLIQCRRAIDDYEVAFCGKYRQSEEDALAEARRLGENVERERGQSTRGSKTRNRAAELRSQINELESRIDRLPSGFDGATASDIATRGRLKTKVKALKAELKRLEK